jgi:hypothetical protein
MAANYLPYEPQQMMLLPESLQEWLPEGKRLVIPPCF